MTSGDPSVTNGAERRAMWLCFAGALVFVLAINTVNVLTALQDDPGISALKMAITEGSSAVSGLAMIWLPWLALKRWPLNRPPWWRMIAVHALALLAFSLVHVAGFVALRMMAWPLIGGRYEFGDWLERFPYELRKDAVSYIAILLGFWMTRELMLRHGAVPPAADSDPATFDIRDGARLVRTPVGEILAVSSAGNYAEFHLADGRKPLMRASLASLETRLGDHGFVRTHRSWLVNAARVTELTPEGSGDYAVTIGGVKAPLSRRFPEALALLRGG